MRHLLLAAALAVGSTSASAATLTFSEGYASAQNFAVPQFDPILGTLNSATLDFDVYADAGGGLVCSDGSFSQTIPMALDVSVLGHSFSQDKTYTLQCRYPGDAFEYLVSAQINETLEFSGVSLAPLIGIGFVPVLINLQANCCHSDATYSLTYDYNPITAVPLPATGGALLLALLGLLGKRLIRRTAAQS